MSCFIKDDEIAPPSQTYSSGAEQGSVEGVLAEKDANTSEGEDFNIKSTVGSSVQIYSHGCRLRVVGGPDSPNRMVVKEIKRQKHMNSKYLHQQQEIEFHQILERSRLPHLVRVLKAAHTPEQLKFHMEYACNGDMTSYIPHCSKSIQKGKAAHLSTVKNIIWQVVKGLQEIHGLGYVHRDLKPSNVLLSHSGKVKLCDFGLVWPIGVLDDSFCGTPQYMPPERLGEKRKNTPLAPTVDFWALGVMTYQLLMGRTPFAFHNNIDDLIEEIYGGYICFDSDYPACCKHFIFNLLQTNPRKRLTLQKIRQHPFFTTDFEQLDALPGNCSCPPCTPF